MGHWQVGDRRLLLVRRAGVPVEISLVNERHTSAQLITVIIIIQSHRHITSAVRELIPRFSGYHGGVGVCIISVLAREPQVTFTPIEVQVGVRCEDHGIIDVQ